MKWTDEQTAVLESRGCNLLVAAAAGSGKTAVLVERIVRLVTEGENPPGLDRILVVTFTKAAAGEMKERIRKALLALSANGDARAREQLSLVSDAPISTIHSFCLTVLQENFHLAGLDPGFRVGEQAECTLMLAEAMDRLMDDCYGTDPLDPAMADLLDCFTGYRDDRRLRERIAEVWRFSRSMPWPDCWMETSVGHLLIPEGTDFGETIWGRILLEQAEWVLEDLVREGELACRLAEDAGFQGYADAFAADMESFRILRKTVCSGWDAVVGQAASTAFALLKRAPKDADPLVKEQLQALRKKVKDGFERLRRDILSGLSETLCAEIRSEYARQAKLVSLVQALDRNYVRMKRRKNLVDFDDMEHLCLKLLVEPERAGIAPVLPEEHAVAGAVPTPLAVEMRKRWYAVMIDEYQDSNLVQETILNAIASQDGTGGNLFMVGDVKQSIYRFRQAMPELFLGKYAAYPAGPGEAARKILLHRNFRSRRPILDAVNLAFSRLMTARLGEMEYTEAEALQPGAVYPAWKATEGAPVEFHLIDASSAQQAEGIRSDRDTDEEDGTGEAGVSDPVDSDTETISAEELESVQEEACWAACAIRNLVFGTGEDKPFEVSDKAGMRPVRYADCAVLLRTTSGWSQVFVEEFAMQGIPLFSDTGSGYFDSVEVGVMLSMLQILDNPLQDIPLAAVLRSPIGQWSETAIATVRQADPAGTLMDAVRKHEGAFSELCRSFLVRWGTWRDLARTIPVSELLDRLYEDTGYDLHAAALPQGHRRQANLRLLSERAARFETTGYRGLFQFIRYVERLRAGKGDMDAVKMIGDGEDVVRLMSIHKSKGLEYPVVLLCGTGKTFNLRDRYNRVLLHHRYGFGPDRVLPEAGVTWPTAAKRALQAVLLREMLSEEMRILYVALTRAKEKLLICGRMAAPSDVYEKMAGFPNDDTLPVGSVLPLRSHAQWLLAAWAPVLKKGIGGMKLHFHTRSEISGMRLLLPILKPEGALSGGKETIFSADGTQTGLSDEMDRAGDPVRDRMAISLEEAERRMAWKPEHPVLSVIPSKMTVTAMKRLWEEQDSEAARMEDALRIACTAPELAHWDDAVPIRSDNIAEDTPGSREETAGSLEEADRSAEGSIVLPAFLSKGITSVTSLRYGTLMHLVLQHLDPVAGKTPDVEETIRQLAASGLIPESEIGIPNRKALLAFVHSPLFERMGQAGCIHRETPFTVRMPAADLMGDPTIPAAENIVLQGVVDCWFLEGDRIILVDYKTDHGFGRVPAYRRQLSWYAAAMEKIVGLPVGETILWFLHAGHPV